MRSARRTATPGLAGTGIVSDHASEASRYLTDGVNLYRYLGAIPGTMGQLIGLEECRSLDVTLWPIAELRNRQLRTVIPAPGK